MSIEKEKVPPAKSMIQGLRCIGYNFSTALADIIDNSISAYAKNIKVLSNPDDDPYVVVFDDGVGMGRNELDNAMTLGSDREFKENGELELGRFGLGLKSASFSQCLCLTVASKKMNRINAMSYNLRRIEETNKWILNVLDEQDVDNIPEIELLKQSKSGTLVVWQDFDKIEEEAASFSESFINTIGAAKKHIELVFHRFYDDINFEFNGHRIEKRDPFLSSYSCSQKGRTQTIYVDNQPVVVTPFVLPYANALTEEHKKVLGNPKSIYDDQGLYIYRNKRLIIWGSWLRMNVRREFNKLARVRVDIPSSLDSVWRLDVKKSSAKIPDKIKDQLSISIKDSIVRSEREVRYKGKKESIVENPIWYRLDMHGGKIKYQVNRDNAVFQALVDTLDDKQLAMLNAYLEKIEECIPQGRLISDVADSLTILNSAETLNEENLIEELILIYSQSSLEPQKFLNSMLSAEPYSKISHRKAEIFERIKNNA